MAIMRQARAGSATAVLLLATAMPLAAHAASPGCAVDMCTGGQPSSATHSIAFELVAGGRKEQAANGKTMHVVDASVTNTQGGAAEVAGDVFYGSVHHQSILGIAKGEFTVVCRVDDASTGRVVLSATVEAHSTASTGKGLGHSLHCTIKQGACR